MNEWRNWQHNSQEILWRRGFCAPQGIGTAQEKRETGEVLSLSPIRMAISYLHVGMHFLMSIAVPWAIPTGLGTTMARMASLVMVSMRPLRVTGLSQR